MPSIPELWEKIPKPLQWTLMISTGAAVFVALLMLVWLVWGSGFIQEKLGIPVTQADMEEQTEQLKDQQSDLVQATVEEAILRYDSAIQEHLREKEDDARRTILDPILKGMQALKNNQETLMRSQASTSKQVQDMPAVFDRKLNQLIEETNQAEQSRRERELLEELLRREQERKEAEGEEEEEPRRPKRRSSIKI